MSIMQMLNTLLDRHRLTDHVLKQISKSLPGVEISEGMKRIKYARPRISTFQGGEVYAYLYASNRHTQPWAKPPTIATSQVPQLYLELYQFIPQLSKFTISRPQE